MADYSPFQRHVMPSGTECFYRDSNHSYWGEIHEVKGSWSGVRSSRLTSPSAVGKVFDLQLADKLSSAAARAGLEWFERKDRRATEGSNVHEKVLEVLAAGERIPSLADVEGEERGYAQGVIAWWADVNPDPIGSELVVLSTAHGYAGRIDLIAEIDGQTTIVDLKTGFIGESAHAQLAGYKLAAEESGYGPIQRCILLKVTPEGDYHELEGLSNVNAFIKGVELFREAKQLGSAVKAQWKETLAA